MSVTYILKEPAILYACSRILELSAINLMKIGVEYIGVAIYSPMSADRLMREFYNH